MLTGRWGQGFMADGYLLGFFDFCFQQQAGINTVNGHSCITAQGCAKQFP
jgi:hypothetical protein